MSDKWYYALNSETFGPVSVEDLREIGKNTPDRENMFVWREGLADWIAFSQFEAGAGKRDTMALDGELKGIGGWLILIAVGMVVAPIMIVSGIMMAIAEFQTYYSSLPSGLVYFVYVEIFFNIALILYLVYVAYLFFTKKAKFPRNFIILSVAAVALQVVDAAVAATVFSIPSTASSVRDLVRPVLSAAI